MRLRCIALVAIALLTGCVSLPTPPLEVDPARVNAAWSAHQQQLKAVTGFQLNGRVAVKGGGLSGALRWQQQGEQFKLRIAGPERAPSCSTLLIELVSTGLRV